MEEEIKLTHSQRYPGFGERELLDKLVEQGKMTMVGERYFFDRAFIKRAAEAYPAITIEEFLESEGINPKDFGRFRKRALKVEAMKNNEEHQAKLRKNPNVLMAENGTVIFTRDFKREIYEIWEASHKLEDMYRYAEKCGIDVDKPVMKVLQMMASRFRTSGAPKCIDGLAEHGICEHEATSKDIAEDSSIINPVHTDTPGGITDEDGTDLEKPERIWRKNFAGIPRRGKAELVEMGVLRPACYGNYMLTDEFAERAAEKCRDMSLTQFLINEGLHPDDIGNNGLKRLRSYLDRKAYERRWAKRKITAARIKKYEKNPYVASVSSEGLELSREFYIDAALFEGYKIEEILAVFEIDADYLSGAQLEGIQETLKGYDGGDDVTDTSEADFDTTYRICFRRMAVLDCQLERLYKELGEAAKVMSRPELKKVCLFIRDRPKDPGNKFTVSYILSLAGISKSSYYNYVGKDRYGLTLEQKDELDAAVVREVFEYKGFRKGVRMVYMLMPLITDRKMGIDKIRRIMRKYGMDCGVRGDNEARQAAQRRLKKYKKENLLKRKFRLYRPNQVRVTDVTYLFFGHDPEADNGRRRAYGSALMDPVTGRLIVFNLSESNDLDFVRETLELSKSHPCIDGGIFHSDQGALYLSPEFQKMVERMGFAQSMSKRGNCWDNATQESFFGHFKDECDYRSCKTFDELKARIGEYQHYYNNERGMWDRNRMTPVKYEEYLLSLTEGEWSEYMEREAARYEKMKKSAAEKAMERYKTLGVED